MLSIVNPLRWHDLPLAYRLAGQGCGFDSRLKITVGDDTVRQALLTGTGRTHIYTMRTDDGSGLGQLHYPAGNQSAWMAYLSPALEDASDGLWLNLIDGLVAAAGERGTINLIAEVDQGDPATAVLRRGSFAIYAHQDIWRRAPRPVSGEGGVLREALQQDHMSIKMLHNNVTPSLLRQVMPPPYAANQCLVGGNGGGLVGLVSVYNGANVLIDIYMPQSTEQKAVRNIVIGALKIVGADHKEVYVRLRGQMTWLGAMLQHEMQFEPFAEQVVMVRHTAHRIKHHAFNKLPAGLDGITSVS